MNMIMTQAQQNRPNVFVKPATTPAVQVKGLGTSMAIWQRNASPWSVYTRLATLPILLLAIWSHTIYGTGFALIASGVVILWFSLNPRLFPAPKNTENWASRTAFGERVWLNRFSVPIPEGENQKALVLSLVSGIGLICAVLGAISANLLICLSGAIIAYTAKLVFLNRMAHLYTQMRTVHPLYRFWSSVPDNDNTRRANTA